MSILFHLSKMLLPPALLDRALNVVIGWDAMSQFKGRLNQIKNDEK